MTTTRRLYLSPAGAAPEGWTHLRTLLRIDSETRDGAGNIVASDRRYFISSLAMERLAATQWLTIVRLELRRHCVALGRHWVDTAASRASTRLSM